MKLPDIMTGPWALVPERLMELQEIYARHVRGEAADLAAIEARIGRPLTNEQRQFEVDRGVAILPVHGLITPKASMFTDVSGMVSTQAVMRHLQQAVADPAVKAIVQYADSPGGSVLGTPELAAAFQAARAVKPVVTFCDGVMASAMVWIGSAADAIYLSGPTVDVGSIGVVAMHRDFSAAEQRSGVITTEFTAGRYKRISSQYQPLSQEGRAHMQERVDYLYSLFVNAVAEHRGVSPEVVLADMADGRMFIGQQAIDVGLADGFMALDELVTALATDPRSVIPDRGKPPGAKAHHITPPAAGAHVAPVALSGASLAAGPVHTVATKEITTMTTPATPETQAAVTAAAVSAAVAGLSRDSLQQGNATLFAALQAEFTAAGATAERERIQAVLGQSMPGHEKLVQELAFDGRTTGPEAAVQVLAAHRKALAVAGQAHFDDAPPIASSGAAAAASGATGPLTQQQKTDQAKAHAKDNGVDFVAAWKALGFE